MTGTVDNVINYRLNQNKSFTMLGQNQGNDMVNANSPSIHSIAHVKGKTLLVDAPTSGYAFLLRKILRENSLELGTDCSLWVSNPIATFCIGSLGNALSWRWNRLIWLTIAACWWRQRPL